MADQFTPDRDLIDRYVQRRVSAAEREQMELWLLENPTELEDVRLADALRRGIKILGPRRSANGYKSNGAALPRWLGWLAQPALAGGAAVLTLAAIVTPTLMYLQAATLSSALASRIAALERPTATVRSLPLEPTRAVENERAAAGIVLGEAPYVVLLDISVRSWLQQFDRFDVSVQGPAGTMELADAYVNPAGTIQVALNTATLTSGHLQIVVRADDGELASYRVAVQGQ